MTFFSKIIPYIIIIVFIIVSIVFIYVGYTIFNTEDVFGNNVISAYVLDSNCIYKSKKSGRNYKYWYDCDLILKYNIDNQEYTKNIKSSDRYYYNGEKINIRYNKNNKNEITLSTYTNRFSGMIFMFIGFVLFIILTYVLFFGKINDQSYDKKLDLTSKTYDKKIDLKHNNSSIIYFNPFDFFRYFRI
jgi:nitrate reductase gamma subunit